MTKKELNQIKAAAFAQWAETETGIEMLKQKTCDFFMCYEVKTIKETKLFTLTHKTQMNSALLEQYGFDDTASVRLVFTAHRQTKTLEF